MAETLYGPWRVVLGTCDDFPPQGFTISGSNNADGRYEASGGASIDLQVEGAAWSVALEYFFFLDAEGGWGLHDDMHRHTRFDPTDGLIVLLDSYHHPTGGIWSGPYYPGLQLICTSMDPEVHPNSTPNPYDFTIPEHPQH